MIRYTANTITVSNVTHSFILTTTILPSDLVQSTAFCSYFEVEIFSEPRTIYNVTFVRKS
jgi:hypothetical protein